MNRRSVRRDTNKVNTKQQKRKIEKRQGTRNNTRNKTHLDFDRTSMKIQKEKSMNILGTSQQIQKNILGTSSRGRSPISIVYEITRQGVERGMQSPYESLAPVSRSMDICFLKTTKH